MEEKKQDIVINISCIISDVIKNLWIIIVVSGFAAMAAYLFSEAAYTEVYTTSATYAVTAKGSSASIYNNLTTAKTIAEVMTDIFSSDALKEVVADDLGISSITGTIKAEQVPESTLINITVTAASPEMAFKIIRSAIDHYPKISDYIVSNAVIDEVSGPYVPMTPSSSFTGTETMIKVFRVSFIGLLALFIVLSVLSDRIKNEKDAEKRLDAKLFGIVPFERKRGGRKKSILITNIRTSFYFVEQVKAIATKLEYSLKNQDKNIVAMTSLFENEGKSTVVANIALALAKRGKKVLLVDADLRKPAMYKVFERKKDADDGGLADYITGRKSIDDIIRYEEDLNFYLVCGRKSYNNSTEMLTSDGYKRFLDMVRNKYDYIILDSSPVIFTADSEVITDSADAVLLIVRQNTAPAGTINDVIDEFSDSDAELLGYVLNRADSSRAYGGTRYGYGYGYGYGGRNGYGGYVGYGRNKEDREEI